MNDTMLGVSSLFGYLSTAVLIVLAIGLYALPTIVAFRRRKRNKWNIAFFNILLGWTVIAWGVTIVDAFKDEGGA